MTTTFREPKTRDELRDAAQAAELLIALELARNFGLIAPNGQANLERCEDILLKARSAGLDVRPGATEIGSYTYIHQLVTTSVLFTGAPPA